MKQRLYFLLILTFLIATACSNKVRKMKYSDNQLQEEGELDEVKMYEDTIWFKKYYAVKNSHEGGGNFSTTISLYSKEKNEEVFSGEYPIEEDTIHQLILYREDSEERRIMLYDMVNERLLEAEMPKGDEYREFGSWAFYRIGKVTDEEIEIVYDNSEEPIVLKTNR